MLRLFLAEHREGLIRRARKKVAQRTAPRASEKELQNGVPLFLDELAETLRIEEAESGARPPTIGNSAAEHGAELLRMGFTVGQVVHGYGDIGQAVTELAIELKARITSEEFHTLSRCLDDAVAGARD